MPLKFLINNSNIWFILMLVLVYFFSHLSCDCILGILATTSRGSGSYWNLYFNRQSPCLDLGHKSWITFVGCSSNGSLISEALWRYFRLPDLSGVSWSSQSPADALEGTRRELPRPVLLMLVGERSDFSLQG